MPAAPAAVVLTEQEDACALPPKQHGAIPPAGSITYLTAIPCYHAFILSYSFLSVLKSRIYVLRTKVLGIGQSKINKIRNYKTKWEKCVSRKMKQSREKQK